MSGIRLAALELVHDKISASLIADSAAAALMKAGRVVRADRVAFNGVIVSTRIPKSDKQYIWEVAADGRLVARTCLEKKLIMRSSFSMELK